MEGAGARAERYRGNGRRPAFLPGLAGARSLERCAMAGWLLSRPASTGGTTRRRRSRAAISAARQKRPATSWCAAPRHAASGCVAMARERAMASMSAAIWAGRRWVWKLRKGAARRKHLRPEPRLALGRFLRARLKVTAAMDLSDGLSLDLHRLSKASGLSAEIEAPPIFRGASLAHALHGGEDYELLFTVAGRSVPARFEGLRLTRIGTMRKGRAGEVRMNGAVLEPQGYDHFRKP